MLKGLYCGDGSLNLLSQSEFEKIESKGVTDIFYTVWADKTPITDYNSCTSRLETILEMIETTDLKLWLDFPALIKLTDTNSSPWDYTYTVPSDTEFKEDMKDKLNTIQSNYEIEGFCFDDYTYPTEFHVSANNEQEQADLATFAGEIKDEVNSVGGKLGLAIGYSDSPSLFASRMVYYESVCDYVMPEVYVHSSKPSGGWVYACVREMERSFTDSENTLLPILISYDLVSNEAFSAYKLFTHVNSISGLGMKGYVIFMLKYLDDDFGFFGKRIIQRF